MSRLLLSLNHPESLDTPIREELEHLIAALQAWANVTGDTTVPGNLSVGGYASIAAQHGCRLLTPAPQNIPNGVETAFSFSYPTVTEVGTEEYIDGLVLPGTGGSIYIKQPGRYLIYGSCTWDVSGAGTYRGLQIRIQSDEPDVDRKTPSAAIAIVSRVMGVFRITQALLDQYSGVGIACSLEAFQDSGGTRTAGATFGVHKLS